MGEYIMKRREETNRRLDKLKEELRDAEAKAKDKACVYVTGSFGRGEAGDYSDLDIFIVGQTREGGDERILRRLDEICIKADLIEATRSLGFPDFSGDGEYLVHYTVSQLTKSLGHPEDDASNTFTARMLLILESRALLGAPEHARAVTDVIASYWRDFEGHRNEFVPGFFANDVLRLWRTFCVNYEARTSKEPEDKRAKRKLKNYKLKHSRLLTCYSAIAYLLAIFDTKKTVTPEDAVKMANLSPTKRLESLVFEYRANEKVVQGLLESYETFLKNTNVGESALVMRFRDQKDSRELFDQANKFGDDVAKLLESVGKNSRFYRMLLV